MFPNSLTPLEFPQLGLFQVDVAGSEVGNDDAGPAVAEALAQDVGAEKDPGRGEEELERRDPAPRAMPRAGGQVGVLVHDLDVLVQAAAGVMQQVALKGAHASGDVGGLVRRLALPAGGAAAVEARLPVRIPARVADPAA